MTNIVKKNILSAAKTIFGEKGFESTSIRDISKRAKVNVAMIAYYFGCKDKLYLSCLSDFSIEKSRKMKEVLLDPKDKNDFTKKLGFALDMLTSSYEEEAPMLKILMREVQADKKKMTRELLDLTSPFFLTIQDFFQKAVDAKIIASTKSAEILTIIFVGALSKPIHSEAAIKRVTGQTLHDKDFRKKYTDHLLEVFINGVVR